MRPVHLVRVLVYTLLTVLTFSSSNLMMGKLVEGAASQSEILRRLGDAPFCYIAKKNHDNSNIQQKFYIMQDKLTSIDSLNDLLIDNI